MPGTYTFRPIQANLTHDTDWLGKMDPYCSFRVGPQRIKGPICRNGGKFPKWEDAAVNVPALNEPSLVVDLLDKDKILHDDNIGSFVVDLQEVQSRGQMSKWYPIYYHKKPAGEILMEAAFQPEIIQQPVVQSVIVEKVVTQPVLVEKVVREEVVTKVPTEGIHHLPPTEHTTASHNILHHEAPLHTEQEFRSGTIIHGISQIHHGGVGHGLVPNANSTFTQGTLHQGHLGQGSLNQGTLNQGTFGQGHLSQGTLNQGTLGQGHLNQGTFGQGSLNQGTLGQGHLNQGTFGQGSLNQGTLNQGSLNQGTLGQGHLNQGTLNQGNLGQGSINQGLGQTNAIQQPTSTQNFTNNITHPESRY